MVGKIQHFVLIPGVAAAKPFDVLWRIEPSQGTAHMLAAIRIGAVKVVRIFVQVNQVRKPELGTGQDHDSFPDVKRPRGTGMGNGIAMEVAGSLKVVPADAAVVRALDTVVLVLGSRLPVPGPADKRQGCALLGRWHSGLQY